MDLPAFMRTFIFALLASAVLASTNPTNLIDLNDFQRATDFVRTPTEDLTPSREDQLRFYSLYKQATVGPCTAAKPWFYEVEATAKWNAWNELEDMSSDEAKRMYIELLDERAPEWRNSD